MNTATAVLLILGCLSVIAGISLIFVPAGLIAAGVLAAAAGVLLLKRDPVDGSEDGSGDLQ